ncbi:DnaD domain protein [Bellilinea sp.]|jgi:DnaD/phage-associated family protein|uniref:DnaD domain-containing protein n=1 Tax=Bellilinea sp. TaxID=2838785 RepID=UPI002ADD5032|nr:DnaD domain protein [Bellilinea sp.]
MKPFTGFPPGKTRLTPLPAAFFSELLPQIDDLSELKVTLYAFWLLDRMEGEFRFFRASDLTEDERLLEGLAKNRRQALTNLQDALERAVQRGSLLKVNLGEEDSLYFLNTPRGRAAVAALQNGEWSPEDIQRPEVRLTLERPNIFRLYEENIGPLTPLIAETLEEAEKTYPVEWIEEAIRAAVESNVRRWRYVEAILRARLERSEHEANRGKSEKDRRRYIQGEYGEFVEH